jgi:hypothetical protein
MSCYNRGQRGEVMSVADSTISQLGDGIRSRVKELESQYENEIIRLSYQSAVGKLEWRQVSNCRFELMTSCDGSNDLPNIVIECCDFNKVMTIDGDVIEISADLIKQLCDIVRQQIKLRERCRILKKTLPKIQSIQ